MWKDACLGIGLGMSLVSVVLAARACEKHEEPPCFEKQHVGNRKVILFRSGSQAVVCKAFVWQDGESYEWIPVKESGNVE
jgi:hypothetical protein